MGHDDITTTNVTLPTLLDSVGDMKMSKISCGINHMAAVTEDGYLFIINYYQMFIVIYY